MALIDLNGLGHFKDKENAMIAADYSATKTYAVGDYVYYNGTLYRCTTAIATAEAWTSGHWTAAKLADDLTAQSEALGVVSNTTNIFTNTASEIKEWSIANGSIFSNTSARCIVVECEPNTFYRVSKKPGGRFIVGDYNTIPSAGNTLSQYIVDQEASHIDITTSNDAAYLVAFVYYASTDGNDYSTMLASVSVTPESAIDRVARDYISDLTKVYHYNNNLSLLTNSGSGRYILGHAFPSGNIETVQIYVTASSTIEVFLYTLENSTLTVAYHGQATSTAEGLLDIPIHKKALKPFYIMLNRVSGGFYYRSNANYDVYSVSYSNTYSYPPSSANHYELGVNVKYNSFATWYKL